VRGHRAGADQSGARADGRAIRSRMNDDDDQRAENATWIPLTAASFAMQARAQASNGEGHMSESDAPPGRLSRRGLMARLGLAAGAIDG